MNESLESMRDTVHVPEDAGEYAKDLERILLRIPDGWGRWISCDKGWYPLIIELDQKLAEIFPDYELHQVKEKFGTLRYYIGFPQLNPKCCEDLDAIRPCEGAIDPRWLLSKYKDRTLQDQYDLDVWYYTKFLPHFDDPEHAAQDETLQPEKERRRECSDRMYKIIDEYEKLSARTCELTGTAGVMMRRGYWYKTLNPEFAPEGYIVVNGEEDDNDLP